MSTHRIRVPAALGAAALALALGVAAGCGGDSGDSALTPEQFREQANAICAAGNARIDAAAPDVRGGPPTGADARAFLDVVTSDVRVQIDEISALAAPEELREDVDALLAGARAAVETIESEGPEALFGGGPDPFAAVDVTARRIGLNACAS